MYTRNGAVPYILPCCMATVVFSTCNIQLLFQLWGIFGVSFEMQAADIAMRATECSLESVSVHSKKAVRDFSCNYECMVFRRSVRGLI